MKIHCPHLCKKHKGGPPTFETPVSNLMTPFNGPVTSGNAIQFQLVNPTPVPPFIPTE